MPLIEFLDRYPALADQRSEPNARLTELRASGAVVHSGASDNEFIVDIDEEAVAAACAAEMLERDPDLDPGEEMERQLKASLGSTLEDFLYGKQDLLVMADRFRAELLREMRAEVDQDIEDRDLTVVIDPVSKFVRVTVVVPNYGHKFFQLHAKLEEWRG